MATKAYNDNKLPVDPRQGSAVLENHFVAGANNRKLVSWPSTLKVAHNSALEDFVSLLRRAMIHHNRDRRNPTMKLVHPV